MRWRQVRRMLLMVIGVVLSITSSRGQGLIVDQASGTTDEVVLNATELPSNRIAQSFTPAFSAVGFVQFSQYVPNLPGNNEVLLMVNLRQGAFDGPIIGSTDPVLLVNKFTLVSTFYFSDNVPVSPGQLYFLEPVLQSAGQLAVNIKYPSSYANGDAWNNGVQEVGDFWFREGLVGVPEPGTMWLGLIGFTGLLCRRRWKKRPRLSRAYRFDLDGGQERNGRGVQSRSVATEDIHPVPSLLQSLQVVWKVAKNRVLKGSDGACRAGRQQKARSTGNGPSRILI